MKKTGLVLSGGGARGAYQAGVLQAIAETAHEEKLKNPFSIITGVSAGAINAAAWACYADDYYSLSLRLKEIWGNLHANRVYKSDVFSLGKTAFKWALDLGSAGVARKDQEKYLLDNKPLRKTLLEVLPLNRLDQLVDQGFLDYLAISATDYSSSESVTFVHGKPFNPWGFSRRSSEAGPITINHILASAAIPILFPSTKVGNRYFGDGCVRNTAPLSPSLHLGAERLLIISVKHHSSVCRYVAGNPPPSIGRIFGLLLNGVLMDSTDQDVELLEQSNNQPQNSNSRKIDYLWIQPSMDLGQIAKDHQRSLPNVVRYLLRGLGNSDEAGELASYLLFEPSYCKRLIEIGYKDGLNQKEKIREFLINS